MKFVKNALAALPLASVGYAATEWSWTHEPPTHGVTKHLRPVYEKRQDLGQTEQGIPVDSRGRGAPIAGGTNSAIDLQNPDNLGAQVTDNGVVVNLKWAFSDSKMRLLNGGWVREQVITDLPASHDISAAQQHLTRGSTRELHWHKVAEWGYVYSGRVLVSGVDETGKSETQTLNVGDIWYFPRGQAHTVQGLEDSNEYLLVFDDGDFDATGTTFNVPDWLIRTPRYILARNFGVNESVFANLPAADPYIVPNPSGEPDPVVEVENPYGFLEGNSSWVYKLSEVDTPEVAGGGGSIAIVDSRNFPISTTLAAAIVTVKPGGIRELHWHPNAEEWLYFLNGTARATVFIGSSLARTFDFRAGDTGVFPDNSGHYVENLSDTEDLIWIEMYKSERVAEISLSQWLAVSPPELVARTLNVSIDFVRSLPKEKQLILPGPRCANSTTNGTTPTNGTNY